MVIAVDITAEPDKVYQLAAYFVDWERQGRTSSVALMNSTDFKFNQIAPSQILTDFGEGVYLVWRVRGSVRIRVTVRRFSRILFKSMPLPFLV